MSNINDFEIQDGILVHYNGSDANVVIPDGVTSIGEEAFRGNESLISVTIPEGVSRIGKKAFDYCHNLISITIPNSVTSIGSGAFDDRVLGGGAKTKNIYAGDLLNYLNIQFDLGAWDSAKLYFNGELATDITIPEGVTSIGRYTFWSCKSLTSVTIPDSVTSIGDQAFGLCSKLDAVYCNSIKSWCNIAFSYSSSNPLSYAKRLIVNGEELTDLVIPDGVTDIGRYAFYGYKQLISVTIPDSVTSIGDSAFAYCSNLSSVTIPNSVTRIENYAFCGCESLAEIDLPESVNYIGESAFSSCRNLLSIIIPGGVTSISESAFQYCRNMTSVTIPEGVERIANQSFGDCSSLKSVVIPDSMNWFNEINYKWGNYIFHENTVVILNHYIKDIEKKNVSKRLVFCKTPIQEIKSTNAKDLAVKGFLTVEDLSVYDDAVIESYKKYLKSKTINYVYFILENDAEMIVKRLASFGLIVGKLADKLMENDLSDETKTLLLESAKEAEKKSSDKKSSANKAPSVTELKKIWSYKKNEDGLTITSYKGVDIKVTIPEKIGKDTVTEIGSEAFSAWKGGLNEVQKRARRSVTEIAIPDSVSLIGEGAFTGCSALSSIKMPDSIVSIGRFAFQGCNGLTEITIPDGVTSIGHGAFRNCTNLAKISIPDSVKELGNATFEKCSSLTEITLPNGAIVLGSGLFSCCGSLRNISIPDSVKKIEWRAFENCISLTEITVPDSVEVIQGGAFSGCKNLKSIVLPKGLKKLESYVFSGCNSLDKVIIPDSVEKIENWAFNNCSNLTICASADSIAKKYAKENKTKFEAL